MNQGHEFTGTVEEIGSEVKNFKKGDQVVSPFTVSWSAWHCRASLNILADNGQPAMLLLQERFFVKMCQRDALWHSGSRWRSG